MKYFFILILIAAILTPFLYLMNIYNDCCETLAQGKEYKLSLATEIYDRKGELISKLFQENRSFVEISKIPEHVAQIFITAEDKNFYVHKGLDLTGIFRALLVDIFSGKIKQGGSTITQQLAKQIYTHRQRSLKRKLAEVFIAREFEKKYSKTRILEMYLNRIYFGHGVYGVKSAAEFYFNKDIKNLNIFEASMLAAIPSAPNRFSPLINPEATSRKQWNIIKNLKKTGLMHSGITPEQFNDFWKTYIKSSMTKQNFLSDDIRQSDKAPYITEHVRRILIKKLGEEITYRGGLKVYTSFDLRHQKIAEKIIRSGIKKLNRKAWKKEKHRIDRISKSIFSRMITQEKKISLSKKKLTACKLITNGIMNELHMVSLITGLPLIENSLAKHINIYNQSVSSSVIQGALAAIDPKTGGITALIGGSGFTSENQLNRAVQSFRQPGSSFKAFVYAAGINSRSLTAATSYSDLPIAFRGTDTDWSPSNYEKKFSGSVTARNAFKKSLNTVSVLIYRQIGPRMITDFASMLMGIPESRFKKDPTLALGTTELTPLEMTRGFAVFANDGIEVKPVSIFKIYNRFGKKIYDINTLPGYKKRKRLISRETSFIMTDMLEDVVNNGTAYSAVRKKAGLKIPAAGKTGTNTKFRDAWFAGFVPGLAATVWLGCDSQKYSIGRGQSGATAAAPLWAEFMKKVNNIGQVGKFSSKPGKIIKVKICKKTGKLPSINCPVINEYFIKGTEPDEECSQDHYLVKSIFRSARKTGKKLIKKETDKQNNIVIEEFSFD